MIKNIKIENFKLFEKIEVKDLKMVNLISGKNNIGKTALLEAINLNVSSGLIINWSDRAFENSVSFMKSIYITLSPFLRDSPRSFL